MIFLAIAIVAGAIAQELPPGASIIERVDISAIAGVPRTLVLWTPDGKQEVSGAWWCGTEVYGNWLWRGAFRVSLVDPRRMRIVNTVELEPYLNAVPVSFPRRSHSFYPTSGLGPGWGSKARILKLKDLTGNGVKSDFAFFSYESCGNALSTSLGYDKQTDRVIRYAIEASGEEPHFWVSQVFGHKPVKPGVWDFVWDPGHGAEHMTRLRLRFDKVRRVFVDESIEVPYPFWPNQLR